VSGYNDRKTSVSVCGFTIAQIFTQLLPITDCEVQANYSMSAVFVNGEKVHPTKIRKNIFVHTLYTQPFTELSGKIL